MTHHFKKLLLLATSIGSGSLAISPAYSFAEDAENATETFEEVVVTGSRIKRKDLAGVGPVTVMTQQMIKNTGITSMETLLQRLPASAGFGGNQTAAYL